MSTVAWPMSDLEPKPTEQKSLAAAVVGFVICVVAPIGFWLTVISWAASALFGAVLSAAALLIAAVLMAVILVPIWAGIVLSSRT